MKLIKIYKRLVEKLLKKTGTDDVLFIGTGEYLPPPLTKDEENELLAHMDDEKNRNILIERNLRLVVFIARKFDNTGAGLDDLISIGAIGLVKAVNTFSPEKNIKLATYAARCIENEILMHLRRSSRTKLEVSLDEPLNVDWDGNELLLSDVLGTENDTVCKEYEDSTDLELLQAALDRLKPRERRIIELRYGLGNNDEKTQKEVADMLGISQSYISRLEKKILSSMKNDMLGRRA